MKFYAPSTATERVLASGRVLAPDEEFDLKKDEADDPHNKRLIEEGHIVEVETTKKGGDEK